MTAACTCTMIAAGTPGVEPDDWEQDPWCPIHPDPLNQAPRRRLAVAGVIRKGEMDPPNTRALAIVVDWNHPRGPVAGKIVWSVEGDAMTRPPTRPTRAHAMDEIFRRVAQHLETGQ